MKKAYGTTPAALDRVEQCGLLRPDGFPCFLRLCLDEHLGGPAADPQMQIGLPGASEGWHFAPAPRKVNCVAYPTQGSPSHAKAARYQVGSNSAGPRREPASA